MNLLVGILKYPPDYAGDGLRLHRTFQRLKKKGNVQNVYVLTSWDQEGQPETEVRDGIWIGRPVEYTLKPIFRKFRKKVQVSFQILKLIIAYLKLSDKIDIVLTSGSGWFPSLIAWLALFTGKPVVKELVLLGSDDPLTLQRCKKTWYRWFFLTPFHFAKLIIAISAPLETACLKFGISKEKIWCRLNPVDFEALPESEAPQNAPDAAPVILWVGALTPRKNVSFLLKAARHLKIPVRLWFVGPHNDPLYYQQLLEIQKEIPSHVEVSFVGHVENRNKLIQLYSQASLFWFASLKEGMGNVVAESLVCGTPVVTLPVMGIMDHVLLNGMDGEIVDTQDPEVFAETALKWLNRKTDRLEISKRARARFNPERVDGEYALQLEQLLPLQKNYSSKTPQFQTPILITERLHYDD